MASNFSKEKYLIGLATKKFPILYISENRYSSQSTLQDDKENMTYMSKLAKTSYSGVLALTLLGGASVLPVSAQSACPRHTFVAPSPTNRTFTGTHGDWQWSIEIPSNYRAMALSGGSSVKIMSPSEYDMARCLLRESPEDPLLSTGFFNLAHIELTSDSADWVSYRIRNADEIRESDDGIPFTVDTSENVMANFFLGYAPGRSVRVIRIVGDADSVYVQEMINGIRITQVD